MEGELTVKKWAACPGIVKRQDDSMPLRQSALVDIKGLTGSSIIIGGI